MALFEIIGIKEMPVADVEDDLLVGAEEQPHTLLHCRVTTSPMYISDWWVNIHHSSHLHDKNSNEKLEMLHVIGIPLAPQKHYLKNKGDIINFTLVFPKVPDNWLVFDFIEDDGTGNGLKAINIKRNNSGIYRVEVQ